MTKQKRKQIKPINSWTQLKQDRDKAIAKAFVGMSVFIGIITFFNYKWIGITILLGAVLLRHIYKKQYE